MAQSTCRVSGILLSYNCEDYIEGALQSALTQLGEPIQLIISDDNSTDSTYSVLQRELSGYRGPHQVELLQQSRTSGSKSAHLNLVLHRATGDIVISFDGDDISVPQRVQRVVQEFDADPRVQAVFSRYSLIDETGQRRGRGRVPHPPSGTIASQWFARVDAYAAGTTLAVRRTVLDNFGALDPEIHEDIVLPFRASLLGDVRYIDEDLVDVRRRADSLTAHPERFDSILEYRKRMIQGIEKARKHLSSRLSDLEAARLLMPQRSAEFTELADLAKTSLVHAEATANLVSPKLRSRLRALWRLLRTGAYREDWAQNLCLALIPQPYLRYKREKSGRRLH